MNASHLSLLGQLETEMANTLLPAASTDMAKQIAHVAGSLIGRWLVEETQEPQLRADAIASLRELLPELCGHLDADRLRALEQCCATATPDTWPDIEIVLQDAVCTLLACEDIAARKLAARLVAIDATLRDRKEDLCRQRSKPRGEGASSPYDLGGLDLAQQGRLIDFIKQRFPTETQLAIAGLKANPGGFSKQTLFIDLKNNVELPDRIVMRRDAPHKTSAALQSVRQEFQVMTKMHAAGVPGPRPLALEETGDVLGTPFMLGSRVTGRNVGTYLLVAESNPSLAADLARQLALIHSVPIGELEPLLYGDGMSVRERALHEIDKHAAIWGEIRNYRSYTLNAALEWLKRNVALAAGPRVVAHRDIGMHNILVEGDRVSGIFDWENCVIGTPAEDIGYVCHAIRQLGDWDDFIAAYEDASGTVLDRRQIDYFTIFGDMRVAVGLALVADAVMCGKINNIQHLYVGEYFTQMTIQRIARKLTEVLAW